MAKVTLQRAPLSEQWEEYVSNLVYDNLWRFPATEEDRLHGIVTYLAILTDDLVERGVLDGKDLQILLRTLLTIEVVKE